MKEKGWIIIERHDTSAPWSYRLRNAAPTKKIAIENYERTTGAYQGRTGIFKFDNKADLAQACRFSIEIDFFTEDES